MKKGKKINYEQPELVDFLDLLGKNVAYGAMVSGSGESFSQSQSGYEVGLVTFDDDQMNIEVPQNAGTGGLSESGGTIGSL